MYYVSRFIDVTKPAITMNELVSQVMTIDCKFSYEGKEIYYVGRPFCEVNILLPGSDSFCAEVKMLKNLAEQSAVFYSEKRPVEFVVNLLDNATAIVMWRSQWPEKIEDQRKMFEAYDPIWDMLTETREGLLHIDAGSFWNKDGGEVLFSNRPPKGSTG
jgi:hypothetical protein